MTFFDILAILIVCTAAFSYFNHRFLRLPITVGVMVTSLAFSLLMLVLQQFFPGIETAAEEWLLLIDFKEALMRWMLGFLLFAGALHVNLGDLYQQKFIIGSLATLGVVASTVLIGLAIWGVATALDLPLPPLACFLFGALIAPTDPIAVMGILKSANAPPTLRTKITGESLFNDGVGVVLFMLLLGVVSGKTTLGAGSIAHLLALEAGGGIVFGVVVGLLGTQLLRRVHQYQVAVLITLAMVMGSYAAAFHLHLSAPLTVVVLGLLVGNRKPSVDVGPETRQQLSNFWELVDEILNVILFVLIGLEVIVVTWRGDSFSAGLLAIPIVLLVRFLSVTSMVLILRQIRRFSRGVITILTWGGIRGGLSVAMALSLPVRGPEGEDWSAQREILLTITYTVVVFSILVQGLTIGRVARWAVEHEPEI